MRYLKSVLKIFFIFSISFVLPFEVKADNLGESKFFFVDPLYDFQKREKISATLKKISFRAYFYIEDDWFLNLEEKEKKEIEKVLNSMSQEFDDVIYPKLTSLFGSEWKPGIDGDEKITILFHKMKDGAGGYFNSGDEYSKIQNPKSNQREMIYLNSNNILSPLIKSHIAHEFVHLITFNQKTRIFGLEEEVWLSEARAEFAPTFLGYDKEYEGSNLWQRVKLFISDPSDSLTEWGNQKSDYGVVNLFIQYLVDNYGNFILSDSLKSAKVGLASLDYALKKNGFQKTISQIFQEWLITLYLNDCNYGQNFCYKNENLKNLKIIPTLIFIPSTQFTEVKMNYLIKEWSGNWFRIIGGEGDLMFKFDGQDGVDFSVSLIFCKDTLNCKIDFLALNEKKEGEVYIENFGKNWTSLVFIPSIQSKISDFSSLEPSFQFSVFLTTKVKAAEDGYIKGLLEQIAALQQKIDELQKKINEILRQKQGSELKPSCSKFENDLYYGMVANTQVSCLQEFLKSQGPEIYPEGLVTGNFLELTRKAVIRFQEKYKNEILKPLGLETGTGFVGSLTRQKINQLLGY